MAKIKNTSLTDREGVALVDRIVTRDLEWYFREQSVVDQGIDAHVEVATSGHGTGRLIALQIKSGPSWFRRRQPDGWTFYYGQRERALWHGHALPVVVVLVDLENDTAYWQRITPAAERPAGKRWAITVPTSQTLSTAAPTWELFASGTAKLAEERYAAHLVALPPQTATVLEGRGEGGTQAQLIAHHLATGRQDPDGTARMILNAQPIWMKSEDGWPWAALANYCAQHGALLTSADALEIAAAHSPARAGERLGIAALHAVQQPSRARSLIGRAQSHGGGGVPVAIAEAILARPNGSAHPASVEHVVAAAGSAVHDNALAQLFLAEQAARSRDHASATRHGQRALELAPEDTNAMIILARVCFQRATTPNAQDDDFERAISLLAGAVTQRRRWAGDAREPLADLARALILQGRPDEALRWLLSPPHGTAEDRESEDPGLLRLALGAAQAANSDQIESILGRMSGDQQDRVAQVRLNILQLPDAELKALWTAELDRAQIAQDYTETSDAVLRLALLGIDASDRLAPLTAAGILPLGAERLPSAIAALRQRPEEGLERLRALAAHDLAAADHLVGVLIEHARHKEAIEACQSAFERYREPRFLTQRALLISAENEDSRAEIALREALDVVKVPSERLKLATRLAALESNDGKLSTAEARLSKEIRSLEPAPSDAVWNLVRIQISSASELRAVDTITRYRPEIHDHEEASLWFHAMRTVAWDALTTSKAIALAARFDDNPKLAVALLSHVIMSTRGVGTQISDDPDSDADDAFIEPDAPIDDRPVVPGDLHRQAFEALDALVRTHGEETGVQIITVDPDEPLKQLAGLLRGSATPDLGKLLDAIARGTVPAGMLAIALGRTYTLALARQAAGQLVAVTNDDDEYELEIQTVKAALEAPVVVDISALSVLAQLTDGERIIGQFTTMLMPRSARDDLLRTVVDVQGLAASSGSLDWDSVAEQPVFIPHTDEQYQRLRLRINSLEALAQRTSVRHERRSVLSQDVPPGVATSPWVAAIETAAHEGVALWCDDIAVRRLARSVGVNAFSTMAVFEVATDRRVASESSAAAVDAEIAIRARVAAEMLAERVVDAPIVLDQVIEQARIDRWSALGPAALAVSRPGWWSRQKEPVATLLRIYDAVRDGDPDQVPHWQYAAMLGFARRLAPDAAGTYLAFLALLGWGEPDLADPLFDNLVAGCQNARLAAQTLGIGDPTLALPAARASLGEAGVERSEELVQALLAAVGPWEPRAHEDLATEPG